MSILTCKGQMPNEKEVYELINDLPNTFYQIPQIDLHPFSLDSVKSRYHFKRLLDNRSYLLFYPEVSKKVYGEMDSIQNLSLSIEAKDSMVSELYLRYPTQLSELFSEADRKKMEKEFLLKKVKWSKRKADKISFSRRKAKMRISVPLFNQQKNLALFFMSSSGGLQLVVFKLTDSGWQGYLMRGVAPISVN